LDSNVVQARFGPREAHDRAFGCPDPPLPGPPLSRRSGERFAVASAGPALVGFRGFSEVQVRKVAPDLVRRSRSAGSAAFRSSLPYRGSRTVARDHSSLNLARPFRARSPKDRRRWSLDPPPLARALLDSPPLARRSVSDRLHPPGFLPLQRRQNRGSGLRGFAAPATFRPRRFSRPRRFTPRDSLRVYSTALTLLGFRLQGLAPPRGSVPLSRPRALLPFAAGPAAP